MNPNILTVDVEDYFQVSGFEHRIKRSEWEALPSRVEANTDRLLQLFDDCNVRGTFFVLGWVAHRHPELLRRIAAAGHELASHGYWHQLVYNLTPQQFRDDIRDSRSAISDATGKRVDAYRAPSFSITSKSMWAFEILVEEGFTVDSSVFPIRHDRYGVPDAQHEIHHRETAAGTIVEIPPSVALLGPLKIPVGGGYFRMFPVAMTMYAMRSIHSGQNPSMLYLHPWEVDPEQPRIAGVGLRSRFRHYVGLRRTERRLKQVLNEFRFAPVCDVLQRWNDNALA
ncbi:Peptidoglycan deacetylase [Rosistilla ulvae]|uniref:Peptidoglycan deacetylase n=1 Tax=Rosistilla ulvae TaxID=1930277 RepID=A0A517M0G0_9BACT|nr:XrtA system polysaccharide deacetylase [Rosistilla ulvae]QDS88357.1 Peptidoglycan deacetylase [Rosistilla ulvae]